MQKWKMIDPLTEGPLKFAFYLVLAKLEQVSQLAPAHRVALI